MTTLFTFLAQTSDGQAATAAGVALAGIFGSFLLVWVAAILVGLAFLIWWIVLLIDCVNRDFPDKNTWLIVLIVGFLLGFTWLVDLLYYFIVIRKYENNKIKNKN
ncbi:MAG: hypothetical protein PHW50_01205 [Patescibacteria group bacterium]|nr:hypothetical protein [Patescibacteria group bacterium]